jgi:hypothetical protein
MPIHTTEILDQHRLHHHTIFSLVQWVPIPSAPGQRQETAFSIAGFAPAGGAAVSAFQIPDPTQGGVA